MHIQATRLVLMRGVIILWLSVFLVPTSAFPVTIIVPSEEVKFEAPALPPPLWRTNYLVMKELALMPVETFKEKEAAAAHKLQRMPRVSSVALNYEWVDGHFGSVTSNDGELKPRSSHGIEYDGNISSAYFKLLWDIDKFSFGGLISYDNLNLDSFDGNRIGTIVFGRYDLPLNDILTMGFTLNGIYTYNGIDSNIKNVTFKDFNTFGTNISISLEMDTKDVYRGISVTQPRLSLISFAGSIAFSYQFSKDDIDRMGVENDSIVEEVDNQHLFMLGANFGMRIGGSAAVTLYGIWNYDATSYKGSLRGVDDNYFDMIIELAWSLSPRWKIHGGYKKILGYEDLDSNQVFVGMFLRF